MWVLPDQSKYYRYPPKAYLTFLLYNSQKGSLEAFLIKLGLIYGLSVLNNDFKDWYSTLRIEMTLT